MFVVTNFDFDLFISTDQSLHDKLAETATKIARRNFEWRYITFVIFNSTVMYGAEKLLQSYEKSQIIGKGLFYPSFAEETRQYVLFGTDIMNIKKMLEWMRQHQFDNTGKHIIVCDSDKNQNCDEKEIVTILWNLKITNVVFLKNGNSKDEVVGYTYFPLEKDCYSMIPTKLENIEACFDNDTYCDHMFPMKLKNLNRCPITVSIYVQIPYMSVVNGKSTGADGDLLRIISEGLNATLQLMTPRRGQGWGKLEEDGSWSGSLADVNDDVANFSMTSAAITLSRFSQFQMSIDYYTTKLVWITHSAFLQPSSLKLLYPIQTSTQIALVLSFLLVILCAILFKFKFWINIMRTLKLGPIRANIVFYSWLIFMGLPMARLPTHQALLSIVTLWIWYCFMIRTIYQVCLVSVLQSNYYYPELNTIEEAHEANYPFGGGGALREFYIDQPLVYDNWIIVNTTDIIPTLFELAKGKKFVLAMNMECAMTLIRLRNLNAHILPQRLITSPTVIFFKKFSPLVPSVDQVLRRLIEFGFADKTYKDHVFTKFAPQPTDTNDPINVEHYKGCYLILIFGWTVSALFFFCELGYSVIYKYYR